MHRACKRLGGERDKGSGDEREASRGDSEEAELSGEDLNRQEAACARATSRKS